MSVGSFCLLPIMSTDKKLPDIYRTQQRFINKGKVLLNMHKHLSVGDILNFSAGFSEVMKSFLIYLDDQGVEDFVQNIDEYVENPQLLRKKYPDFFDAKKDASSRTTIAAIRKRIRHLIDDGKGLHSNGSKLIEDVFEYLKQGKTVVIDLSLKDNTDASILDF